MKTRGTTLKKVSLMQFAKDEQVIMDKLNTVWVQTMDRDHTNILAYRTNIIVEDINEACPLKYIDLHEFFTYEAENGSHWLVSRAMELQDMDEFFRNYLHMEDEAA